MNDWYLNGLREAGWVSAMQFRRELDVERSVDRMELRLAHQRERVDAIAELMVIRSDLAQAMQG